MGVTGHSGIIVRQAGNRLITRAHLLDSAGNRVTSGTCNLRLLEQQDDGTYKTYDFADNVFESGAVTTPTATMTHRTAENGTVNTGLWTHVLSTLTGLTAGAIYVALINHASAAPQWQAIEFQYGGFEAGVGIDPAAANTHTDAATYGGQLALAGAAAGNKITINQETGVRTLFKADGVTALRTLTATSSGDGKTITETPS